MTETTFLSCCAECTCVDFHQSEPTPGIDPSEGFATTETPTICCVECICTNPHQSKPQDTEE